MRRLVGPELLTPDEVCAVLNTSNSHLDAWILDGALEYYLNMNGCRRYARSDVEALINIGYGDSANVGGRDGQVCEEPPKPDRDGMAVVSIEGTRTDEPPNCPVSA